MEELGSACIRIQLLLPKERRSPSLQCRLLWQHAFKPMQDKKDQLPTAHSKREGQHFHNLRQSSAGSGTCVLSSCTDHESCSNGTGNQRGRERRPAVAKHRGKNGGAPNQLGACSCQGSSRAPPQATEATVAAPPRYTAAFPHESKSKDHCIILTHLVLYYNCDYL